MKKKFRIFLIGVASAIYPGFASGQAVDSCLFSSPLIDSNQVQVIAQVMGSHPHRLAHLLWHSTRNGWDRLTPQERATIQQLSPLWGRHAPVCPPPDSGANINNPAGEEFLFMHHKMIAALNAEMVRHGQFCTSGWRTFPLADDQHWPVPPGVPNDSSKSAEVGRLIEYWSRVFTHEPYLQTHTLSEIGYLVEFSIHNQAHMRWATIPRPNDDFTPLASGGSAVSLLLPSPFDAPQFNWLGNPYSSHVNPVFWKLHGWIDDVVIPAWLRARGFATIAERCPPVPPGTRQTCYQWRSQWVGDMPNHSRGPGGGGMPGHHGHAPTGVDTTVLDRTIQRMAPFGSFRNDTLDQILGANRSPVGGAGPGTAPAPAERLDWNDPAKFVADTGPCRAGTRSPNTLPSFLR